MAAFILAKPTGFGVDVGFWQYTNISINRFSRTIIVEMSGWIDKRAAQNLGAAGRAQVINLYFTGNKYNLFVQAVDRSPNPTAPITDFIDQLVASSSEFDLATPDPGISI